jgi:hypothetical protein
MITYNPEAAIRREDKHVLCDADCVAYWGAAGCNDQALRTATRRVDLRMNQILDECKASTMTNYLTGKDNFRDGVATLQRYKGNRYDKNGRRIRPQPDWLQESRAYIEKEWGGIVVAGQEADDALSIHRARYSPDNKDYIISTIDKDLLINLGWHHNQNSGEMLFVKPEFTPLEIIKKISKTNGKESTKVNGVGQMFFYAQLLMGDAADWIKGLPKVTPEMKEEWPAMRRGGCGQMTAVHVLDGCVDEEDAHNRVWFCYKSYWMEHSYTHWANDKIEFKAGLETARLQMTEQGQLLHMRQKEGEMWIPKFPML